MKADLPMKIMVKAVIPDPQRKFRGKAKASLEVQKRYRDNWSFVQEAN